METLYDINQLKHFDGKNVMFAVPNKYGQYPYRRGIVRAVEDVVHIHPVQNNGLPVWSVNLRTTKIDKMLIKILRN